MRKIKYGIMALVLSCCFSLKANALYFDYTPLMLTSLQFCGMCTPSAISEVSTSIELVKRMSDEYKKLSNVKDVLRKLEDYALSLGSSLFNSEALRDAAREKVISYSRTIKKCSIADMDDAASVKKAFKKLFLQYPSDDPKVMAAYHDKLEQFREDTAVEMYITATEMDKELQVMFAQLDNIEKCLVLGEKCDEEGLEEYNCQSEDTEDKVCLWRNALTAVRIYDRLMRYNEYLTAMIAQMNAVDNVGYYAMPKEFDKNERDEEIQSYNDIISETTKTFSGESIIANAFEIVDVKSAGVVSSLAGKEEDFEGQKILAEGEDALDKAKRMHNLKQQLPNMLDSFVTFNKMKKYHEKTLNNVIQSHYCVLSYIEGTYKDEESVWLGECKLEYPFFECKYNPEKSLSDDTESFGLFDVDCNGKKCYTMDVGDYYKVGGTGGWLTNVYKEISADLNPTSAKYANAASKSGVKNILHMSSQDGDLPKNGGTSLIKSEDMDDIGTGEESAENSELKLQIEDGNILEDVLEKEAKAADLLSWTLGATFNQMIADDTVSEQPKLGNAKGKFPLWVDQKNFYNQYIDGKYENIREYIKNEPLYDILLQAGLIINETYSYNNDVDEVGNITKTAEEKRKEVARALEGLLSGLANDEGEKVAAKIAEAIKQEEGEFNTITEKYLSQRRSLEEQRKSLFVELEAVSILLDEARDQLSKANDDIETADQAMPIDTQGEDYVKKQKSEKTGEGDIEEKFVRHELPINEYPQYKEYNKDNKQQADNKKNAESSKSLLLGKIKEYENRREGIRADIDEVEEKIDKLRGEYVEEYYKKMQENNGDLDVIASNKLTPAEQQVAAVIDNYPVLILAEQAMEQVRQNALKQLDILLEKLNTMKINEELYYADNNGIVVDLHNAFLAGILGEEQQQSGNNAQDRLAALLVTMFNDVAGMVGTDDKYFVGYVAQKNDFVAPKAPVAFSSAPVREIFHFDEDDYDAIDKHFDNGEELPDDNKNVLLVGQIFIDSYQRSVDDYAMATEKYEHKDEFEMQPSLDFPEIWYYVLKNRPFEEKQIDLQAFLNSGNNEGAAFLRAGVYPCASNSGIIDVVSTNEHPWAAYNPNGKEAINECMYIVENKDVEANQKVQFRSSEPAELKGASELGQILDYVIKEEVIHGGPIPIIKKSGRLTFRKELQHAVYVINEYGSLEEGADETPYHLYRRAMFSTNVFGDFLDNVSLENKARESKENVKNQLYGSPSAKVVVNAICDAVQDTVDEEDGIVIKPCQIEENLQSDGTTKIVNHRDEFDLTNEDLYAQLEKVMDDQKTKYINKAKEKIDSVKNVVTDSLKGKVERAKALMKLLEIDEDEIVNIAGYETEEQLKEKIKNAKADNSVTDKYKEKRNSAMDDQIKSLRPPYCQTYRLYY